VHTTEVDLHDFPSCVFDLWEHAGAIAAKVAESGIPALGEVFGAVEVPIPSPQPNPTTWRAHSLYAGYLVIRLTKLLGAGRVVALAPKAIKEGVGCYEHATKEQIIRAGQRLGLKIPVSITNKRAAGDLADAWAASHAAELQYRNRRTYERAGL
jgi:hypothetical protein